MARVYSASARRRGVVTIVVAMATTATVGVLAIALDGGYLMDLKRQTQGVADAAALAGAFNLYKNFGTYQGLDSNGTAAASARATAVTNGFAGSNVTVSVNTSPTNYSGGAHKGTPIPPGYIEVIVKITQPPFFSGVLGARQLTVSARAVARGLGTIANGGAVVLNPNQQGTLQVTGDGLLTVTAPTLAVNSRNPNGGADVTNALVSAPLIGLGGNPGYTLAGTARLVGAISSGQQLTADPLAYLAEPNASALGLDLPSNASQPSSYSNSTALTLSGGLWPNGLQLNGSGSVTLNPGLYQGGITVSGEGDVTFNPGVYYIDGGKLNLSGQGNVTASHVMFYVVPHNNNDGVTIAGQGTTSITPMTRTDNPTYAGITLFQHRSAQAAMNVTGNGNLSVDGTLYAPRATINITSNGGTNNIGSELISDSLTVTGEGVVNISSLGTTLPPRRVIGLVE